MKCSQCGAELPEDSQFCNKCGAEVESVIREVNVPETDKQEYNNAFLCNDETIISRFSAKSKIVIVAVASIVLIIIFALCFIRPLIEYSNAIKLFNSHQYNQAMAVFTELDNYKDSPDQINKCRYQIAKELLSNKKYDDAIKAFSKLGNYADSKNMINESEYEFAKNDIIYSKYAEAVSLLSGISKYKDSAALLQESQYNLAYDYYNNGQYSDAIKLLKELDNYKESEKRLRQALYSDAVAKYKSGNFSDAKNEFLKTSQVYDDSKTYLSNLNILLKVQGTWEENETKFQKIFSGWKVSVVCYPNSNKTQVYDFNYTLDNNKLTIVSDDIIMLNGDKLTEKDYLGTYTYTKISSDKSIPASSPEPSIGMTAEEVRSSQWGEPESINKTTTASTVHEQWVYPNNKYIYLDNGIVTAIQD